MSLSFDNKSEGLPYILLLYIFVFVTSFRRLLKSQGMYNKVVGLSGSVS